MAKTKKPVYEIGVILSPTLDEKSVEEEIEKFKAAVEGFGIALERVDLWGRRRLEYEIDRRREGIYYFAIFSLGAEAQGNPIDRLRRWARLNENVMREQIIKLDHVGKKPKKKVRRSRGTAKEAAAAAAPAPAPAPAAVEAKEAVEGEAAAVEESSESETASAAAE
jgi:small subunit ribosomal protein S6